jgi:hypothetical protein
MRVPNRVDTAGRRRIRRIATRNMVLVDGLAGPWWAFGMGLLSERSEVRILPRALKVLVEAWLPDVRLFGLVPDGREYTVDTPRRCVWPVGG